MGLLLGPGAHTSRAAQETLTILHTSEHHGTALPIARPGELRVGGMASRATLVASVRRATRPVLLVDSGDILIGSALSSWYRGEPDIRAMNLMRYQAMAAGNHEFDYGLDHLAKLSRLADFPILCSNLESRTGTPPCRPFALVETGRLTVGLIGLLGRENFPDTFNREVVRVLTLSDPIDSARMLTRRLKAQKGAELVVAITHQTTDEDLALLAEVPEIDVIIGGHTEGFEGLRSLRASGTVTRLSDPGTVYVKTHRQGRTVGRLDLVITRVPGRQPEVRVLEARATNLPVNEKVPPDQQVFALIEEYSRKLEADSSKAVGRSLVALDGESSLVRSRETNLGNVLADILRTRFGADVGLVNGGQIRDSIPSGPVTFQQVIRALPFDSPTVTFDLAGQHLLLALENSVSKLPRLDGRFLQVSGIAVTYDLSEPPGRRVREVTVNGKPLDPGRTYTIATDSFLADGGDGYTMLASGTRRIDRQIPMRDLFLEALGVRPIKTSVRNRIRFVESRSASP